MIFDVPVVRVVAGKCAAAALARLKWAAGRSGDLGRDSRFHAPRVCSSPLLSINENEPPEGRHLDVR